MRLLHVISSAIALGRHLVGAYLVPPPGTAAPGASVDCSEWVQDSYGLTCAIIEEFYGMTAEQFEEWNPTTTELGSGCNLIEGLYYCVQVNFVSYSFLSTGPPTTSTSSSTTTSTSSPVVTTTSSSTTTIPSSTTTFVTSTTKSGNGITTPTPTQTGMVSNCDSFYLVVSGDTCYNIATTYGISLATFYAWNPAVGTSCSTLDVGYYVCVGITGSTTTTASSTTTTAAGTGITTPTPIQTGMVTDCDKFHYVVSGDTCDTIATAADITLTEFYDWNPAVGTTCASLWAQYYVCIGITGSTTATTTATTTTTTTGDGVATPTPIQTGMVTNCDSFHYVVSGDTCYSIATAAGITLTEFYDWNPAVGTSCASLWAEYYVCIGTL